MMEHPLIVFSYLYDYYSLFVSHRTPANESFLIAAIRHSLEDVADRLCELGVDVNQADSDGNSPLWVALRSKQEAVAAKLVSRLASLIITLVWRVLVT